MIMIPDRDSTFKEYVIRGISVLVMDRSQSVSSSWIADEIAADDYGLERIDFHPGDVVIDVGAHIGMFSIYLAKKYPFLSILAFEPEPVNFNNLCINLAVNKVNNITPHETAVTKDARSFLLTSPFHNSGGAGGFWDDDVEGVRSMAASETLERIFESNQLKSCKLLKIDCEGAEHEILVDSNILSKVEWLSVECHINKKLRCQGYTSDRLVSAVLKIIPADRLTVKINES